MNTSISIDDVRHVVEDAMRILTRRYSGEDFVLDLMIEDYTLMGIAWPAEPERTNMYFRYIGSLLSQFCCLLRGLSPKQVADIQYADTAAIKGILKRLNQSLWVLGEASYEGGMEENRKWFIEECRK